VGGPAQRTHADGARFVHSGPDGLRLGTHLDGRISDLAKTHQESYAGSQENADPEEIRPRIGLTIDVLQIYAHIFIELLDGLGEWERWISTNPKAFNELKESDGKRFTDIYFGLAENCRVLGLSSSLKQMQHMASKAATCTVEDFSVSLREFRRRILEDCQDKVFFSISDPGMVREFFKISDEDGPVRGLLVPKHPDEIFDQSIVQRFPSVSDDINEAAKCYVCMRYAACTFHLMRIVEVGVRKVANVADIQDPRPSWGAVLQKVEKLVLRTAPKDVPTSVQPHMDFLRDMLPRLQAIQHAWRNKFSHVEDKIVPTDPELNEEIAREVMNATRSFMRKLATDLPVGF